MKPGIRGQEDFWAGVLFMALGILAIVVARDYPMGEAMRMGPGYFPTWIGAGLVVLGAIVMASGLAIEGPRVGGFAWRAVVLLSAAFVFFGLTIDRLGLVIALAGLVLLSSLAGREKIRPLEVMALMVSLIVGAWFVFIYILELPYPLWWWR